jgi:hypothetical protein
MVPMAQYMISVLFDDTTDTATAEEMAAIDTCSEPHERRRKGKSDPLESGVT